MDGGGAAAAAQATCNDKTMGLVSGNFGIQFCVDRTEVTNTDYEAFLANAAHGRQSTDELRLEHRVHAVERLAAGGGHRRTSRRLRGLV